MLCLKSNGSGVQMKRNLAAIAMAGVIGFAGQTGWAADLYDPTSRPLGAAEIADIFSDHTWRWEAGAGYFAAGGEFRAWSVDEAGTTGYGIGQWTADDAGVLCFEAEWQFNGQSTQVGECFGHRQVNSLIYQRVEPDGDWHVFSSDPPQDHDEISMLVPGDEVTARIDEMRAE
jgi:hypothetical protein